MTDVIVCQMIREAPETHVRRKHDCPFTNTKIDELRQKSSDIALPYSAVLRAGGNSWRMLARLSECQPLRKQELPRKETQRASSACFGRDRTKVKTELARRSVQQKEGICLRQRRKGDNEKNKTRATTPTEPMPDAALQALCWCGFSPNTHDNPSLSTTQGRLTSPDNCGTATRAS